MAAPPSAFVVAPGQAADSAGESLRLPWWTLGLCLLLCLGGIFDHDLWTPDEPRDAAVALEMGQTGDFVVPHLAGRPFIEKPPLYFAVAGILADVAGPWVGNVGAIRLASALFGLGWLAMTFLLGRRLMGRPAALLAVAALATMPGFVESAHWIRVDVALGFFVTGAVWCFAEVFFGGRRWFCLPAGLFAGGAFLSKGLIGPLLIAVAWFGLLAPWVLTGPEKGRRLCGLACPHLTALAAFLAVAGTWVLLLLKVGGEPLWHEWFWTNHVGRFQGTTPELAHLRPGHPFYYVRSLVIFTIPWLLALPAWIADAVRKGWQRRRLEPGQAFLALWGFGSLVMLSLSITKRDVYLAPVLSAFALMVPAVLARDLPRWLRLGVDAWTWLCGLLLAALAAAPLVFLTLHRVIPARWMPGGPASLALHAAVAGLAAFGCLHLVVRRREIAPGVRLTAAAALLYLGAFALAGNVVDREKSMRSEIQRFVKDIPAARRPHVAGWKFDETTRGIFFFYANWAVPPIEDRARLAQILAGQDPEFDSLITSAGYVDARDIDLPHRVLARANPGDLTHKRDLLWIAGPGGPPAPAPPP